MQHTEAYNLNLIETSDTFSPDPLNQNAQLLEDAVEAEAAARTAADSALSQRLQVFEAHRLKYGTYRSDVDQPLYVNVGFKPAFVFIQGVNLEASNILYLPRTGNQHMGITDTGFEFDHFYSGNISIVNQLNKTFFYIAFA